MSTSWCDKVTSTPTAGYKLDVSIASSASLLDAFVPILQPHTLPDAIGFAVEQQDPLGLSVNMEDGFRLGVDPAKVHVTFSHRVVALPVSGGPPRLEMSTSPTPYTALLSGCFSRLNQATMLLPRAKERKINRVGVVSLTQAALDELPPGILRLFDYLDRPWPGPISSLQMIFEVNVNKGAGYTDHCLHTINKPKQDDQLVTINLDWGRMFDDPKQVSERTLKSLKEECTDAALGYFEELAEGNRFDEILINQPV